LRYTPPSRVCHSTMPSVIAATPVAALAVKEKE